LKGSEAILRATHQVRGEILITQFDMWLGQLAQLGLLEQVTKDDDYVYYTGLQIMQNSF